MIRPARTPNRPELSEFLEFSEFLVYPGLHRGTEAFHELGYPGNML